MGSVGHVLKRAFVSLFPAPAQPVASRARSRAGSSAGGAEGKEDGGPAPAVPPPVDARAVEELYQVRAHVQLRGTMG